MTKLMNQFLEFVDEMQAQRLPSFVLFDMFVKRHNLHGITANRLYDALAYEGIL